MKRLLLTLVLLWSFASLAHATTRYVAASGGSNGNPGTIGAPYATIAYGLSQTFAGDILYIRAGTHSGYIRSYIETIRSGTSWANPVTIAGFPGERPTLVGGMDISTGSGIQYVVFQNFIMDGSPSGNNGVFIGSNFTRLQDLEIIYYPGPPPEGPYNGLQVYGDDNEFLTLDIHPSSGNENLARTHGIYCSTARNLFDRINSHNNGGYGIQIYNGGDNTRAHDNVVRNSRLHHNGGSDNPGGLTMNSGTNNRAYNNLIYNNQSGAVGLDVSYSGPNARVYNNTIYNNAGAGIMVQNLGTVTTTNTDVRNNIVYGNSPDMINNGVSSTFQNNLCASTSALCTYSGNPLFVNAAAGDFHLNLGTSPAVNVGTNVFSTVAVDYDGIARPSSGAFEVGAYEFGGSSIGAPTKVRVTAQPQDAVVGQRLPEVVVQILDATDALVSTASDTVTLALTSNPSGTIPGGTLTRAAVSGRAVFADLSIPTAGQGYTLTAASSGLTGDTSQPFRVWGREWSATGVGVMLCSDVAGDTNVSASGAGAQHVHSLTCPLPAGALRQGTFVRVCSLLTLHSGTTAGSLEIGLKADDLTLVTQEAYPTSQNVTNNASWLCFVVVGTAAPGGAVNTYTSYEQFPSGIQYPYNSSITPQPVVLPTNAPMALRLMTQWGSTGSGDNSVQQLALFVEVPK